jgi:hypothetical protein
LDECSFRDLASGSEYLWERTELESNGLYVKLGPYAVHAFEIHAFGIKER